MFHVLNRGVGQMQLFRSKRDYAAFNRVVEETLRVVPIRMCAYCWMPNHWHFVLWPESDDDLSRFMHRMTNMHTQRWHQAKGRIGHGHLYQGRFKSFPVESDEHFYAVVRYVERNALRAGLVQRAEDWQWGSLHQQTGNTIGLGLCDWPLPRPSDWVDYVNTPQADSELEAIQQSVRRGSPFGSSTWIKRTAGQLGLESTLRKRGRPRKE